METIEKPLNTKVKVVKEEPCEVTFSVDIPKDEVSRETDSVFQQIQSRASLPGFRTGKAPLDLVKRNFNERAKQTVLENLIGKAAAQVIREKKISMIDRPKVEKIDFEEGKPLSFQMKVERDPEIKAKNYKGLKVTRPAVKVVDADVAKSLDELRERNATIIASEAKTVGKDHFVTVDFEGKIDGKTFRGGSAKNFMLDMTQPQTIAGFSEGVLKAKIGETKVIPVTFPADYPQKEWAGKQAVFEVTVKEIKEKKLPALDDDFAKDLGLTSLDELKQKVRENMEKEENAKADKDMEEQIYQGLLDANPFAVPPTLVEERTQTLTQRALTQLTRQGLVKPGDKQAEDTLKERSKPQAEKDVRLSYILRAIAAQEKLDAAQSDVDDLKKKALDENKDQTAQVEKYFQEKDQSIRASLTEGKVFEFLKTNAKTKTTKD